METANTKISSIFGSHKIFKYPVFIFAIILLLKTVPLYSLFSSEPKVSDSSDQQKVDITYDLITIKDRATDQLIEDKGKLTVIINGLEYKAEVPDADLQFTCVHYGQEYAQKICKNLEKVCRKDVNKTFKEVEKLRKTYSAGIKQCFKSGGSDCIREKMNSLGRDYTQLKTRALTQIETDVKSFAPGIENIKDAQEWNKKLTELEKARTGVRLKIAWKSAKSTFKLASAGAKIAESGGLNIAAYASVVKETYEFLHTLYEGYGDIKDHIEKLNMNLGGLRYADSIENMEKALNEADEAIQYLEAAALRNANTVFSEFSEKLPANIEKINSSKLDAIIDGILQNQIKDKEKELADLTAKKATAQTNAASETRTYVKQSLLKTVEEYNVKIANLTKEIDGRKKKEAKYSQTLAQDLPGLRASLLEQLKKVSFLINDLLIDPLGIPLREVIDGSEGVKTIAAKKKPMKLLTLGSATTVTGAYSDEKLSKKEAETLKTLSTTGSYEFKEPGTTKTFSGTDEAFILKYGANEYIKQKKKQKQEKEQSRTKVEKAWALMQTALGWCDQALEFINTMEGEFETYQGIFSQIPDNDITEDISTILGG